MKLPRLACAAVLSVNLAACVADDPATSTAGGGGKADGYDAWREQIECEPDTGVCIVEGDIPLVGEAALQAYFESRTPTPGGLSVFRQDDVDLVWNAVDRFNLTYCVSPVGFTPEQHAQLVAAMATATAEWEAVAKVDYRYVPEENARCEAGNRNVRFVVTDAPPNVWYIARAFFPYYEGYEYAIRMSFSALEELRGTEPTASLEGILRHELGHTLGFRHEHIRPESTAYFCRESSDFRPITAYDRRSTMHYPWCDGEGDWSLQLTELDKIGAAFFYPDFTRFRGDRCAPGDELRADGSVDPTCEPVVHEILELANTASAEVLRQDVGLDIRAVDAITSTRGTAPFTQLADLDAITYVGPVALRRMYDYLYVDGRCGSETDLDGLIDTRCRPVVHRLLQLANTAGQDILDFDVALDRRAAENIVARRAQQRFTSLVELWAVPYVKTTALAKMYDYLY